jgi:hypothetical protein
VDHLHVHQPCVVGAADAYMCTIHVYHVCVCVCVCVCVQHMCMHVHTQVEKILDKGT